MPAFYILAALAAVALVFALAPLYKSIGKFFTGMVDDAKNAMEEDDDEIDGDDDEIN